MTPDLPIITRGRRIAALLAALIACYVDKTLGHLCLDFHDYIPRDWEKEYEERIAIVHGEVEPRRAFKDVPDGKSGNRKLDVNCSYCPVKRKCWPNLRGFAYSYGPVYLTHVAREPNVPEFEV